VVYSLTEYGESLRPVTEAMCQWGRGHMGAGVA
jgi:DNA-binding HxlR family transcriptional regulator